MDNVQNIFDKILDGLQFTDDEKKAFVGLYLILYYKASLEALIGIKASDPAYLQKVREFFETSVNSLDEQQAKEFDAMMAKEKGEILVDVVDNFKNNLSDDLKQKVEANVAGYLNS